MVVRRTRRAVAAALAAGLIGLVAVGCSEAGTPVAAAVPVAPGDHADVLATLPAAVDGAKIVVGRPTAPHTVTVYVDGLRSPSFDRAVRDESYRSWVADSQQAFEDSGVGGTPTVLVDGTALPGGDALYDAAAFSKALRDAGV
ncbi:DsbA family protein [Streptomyces sp. NPDC053253]|uniref:DsbA family protein n=1 Tax=Streptomyces sp. NPDC053253 TaxID=3365699 RepID=UPI0037D0FF22